MFRTALLSILISGCSSSYLHQIDDRLSRIDDDYYQFEGVSLTEGQYHYRIFTTESVSKDIVVYIVFTFGTHDRDELTGTNASESFIRYCAAHLGQFDSPDRFFGYKIVTTPSSTAIKFTIEEQTSDRFLDRIFTTVLDPQKISQPSWTGNFASPDYNVDESKAQKWYVQNIDQDTIAILIRSGQPFNHWLTRIKEHLLRHLDRNLSNIGNVRPTGTRADLSTSPNDRYLLLAYAPSYQEKTIFPHLILLTQLERQSIEYNLNVHINHDEAVAGISNSKIIVVGNAALKRQWRQLIDSLDRIEPEDFERIRRATFERIFLDFNFDKILLFQLNLRLHGFPSRFFENIPISIKRVDYDDYLAYLAFFRSNFFTTH